ncbi:MAG: hypothetical protein V2A79_09125 [Planctomycetota bacterium]
MSEELTSAAVTAPVGDATIVHDEAAEEKSNDKLVADVAKMLGMDETSETTGEPDKPAEEKPPKAEQPKAEEPKGETPAWSDELQSRAEGAGLSTELAQHLHQTGHLEETLAAFDRQLIERFQSKETEEKPEEKPKLRETPPPRKPEASDQEDAAELDPEVYDEGLVKRDAYHKRRIDALEAQLSELLQERSTAFDKRFDGLVDAMDHEDLFGKGGTVPKDKQANRNKLFRAYTAVCQMHDVDPTECDPQWGKRALAAMFPEEVFKKAQRETVDRLRDAERKFLSPSKPRGAPPAKAATEEEADAQLVSKVTRYLKEQGVQMSGV